jgi:hypothetical protein
MAVFLEYDSTIAMKDDSCSAYDNPQSRNNACNPRSRYLEESIALLLTKVEDFGKKEQCKSDNSKRKE